MEKEIEKHYQMRAKGIVDMLFDAGLFHEEITRDDMNVLEDVIAYQFQADADSNMRVLKFSDRIKKHKKNVESKDV